MRSMDSPARTNASPGWSVLQVDFLIIAKKLSGLTPYGRRADSYRAISSFVK